MQEQSKHYTGLSKSLAELSDRERNQVESIISDVEQMHSFDGTIRTLALQAAIDAGRLGEAGTPYIQTAEEIRSLASEFANRTEQVTEKIQHLLEEHQEMDRQIHSFISLLKDNNMSLGKLAGEARRECQKESVDAKELKRQLDDVAEGYGDLQETISSGRNRQEQIMLEMESIGSCYMEQQDSTGKMEEIIGDMKLMFSQIDIHNENV